MRTRTEEIMDKRIRSGMNVRSTSGIALGRIMVTSDDTFLVAKGVFFPKDHELRYEGIVDIRGDDVVYRLAQENIAAPRPADWKVTELADGKELRMPLMEEELTIQKSTHEAGSVRIHKNVVTEERHLKVPLRREEVIVEHQPVTATPATTNAHPFEEERYVIPLHEEGYELVKRAHVKEQVTVRCVAHEEEAPATATVRHEEMEVERTGDINKEKREL
jgi:uncharacterized protein (TIGR02271 family)